MQQLAREIARLARELQHEIEQLPALLVRSNEAGEAGESGQRFDHIERKLEAIHADTSQLVDRVPSDLEQTLTQMKQALLLRLSEAAESVEATGSTSTGPSAESTQLNRSPTEIIRSLSPQERRVFRLCFRSGFLSYREIAGQLNISASSAKNLINRMLQSQAKGSLFAKRYHHGAAQVGVRPRLQNRILRGAGEEVKKKRLAVQR